MHFSLLYFISLFIYYVFISRFIWHFDNGELILVIIVDEYLQHVHVNVKRHEFFLTRFGAV